jgi:FkbH-like protein
MRLAEALQIAGRKGDGLGRSVHLLTGFSPLHLQTFLRAWLQLRFSNESFCIHTGLYGDLEGNLDRALDHPVEGTFLFIEWEDVDPRLGFRGSGGWTEAKVEDLAVQAKAKLARMATKIEALARKAPLVLIPPTLPLPLLIHSSPVQASKCEVFLNAFLSDFLADLSSHSGVRLLSALNLAVESPFPSRHDINMELAAGFPYSLAHADTLARLSVNCLFPIAPKKGLITDLDQTLWKGILGDVDVQGVSWSIEDKAQVHALYQQLLGSLAAAGVLLAVASKNDPQLVTAALQRADLLLPPESIFPVDAGWGPKSEAVGRILKAWNVGADSVVFVDDSPMELSEVSEKYPQIECLLFPSSDPAGALTLLKRLRELFGKEEIREEDRLRAASLRSAVQLQNEAADTDSSAFVAQLKARITFEPVDGNQKRAMELVNKTNQFNLNGARFGETEWLARQSGPGSFITTVSYEDRFGPLGRIAVLGGCFQDRRCVVDIFVMSCRAFSRLIEFQILRRLFEVSGAESILLKFTPTERNGPMQTFLGRLNSSGFSAPDGIQVSAAAFAEACPTLNHEVIDRWTIQQSKRN